VGDAIHVLGKHPRSRGRVHRSIVAEGEPREQYDVSRSGGGKTTSAIDRFCETKWAGSQARVRSKTFRGLYRGDWPRSDAGPGWYG
jgi:hypothetical protein